MTQPRRPSHFRETPEERTIEPTDDYPTDVDVETDENQFGWPPDDMEPIPVYLTETLPRDRELIAWSSDRFTLEDEPVQIAGDNRNRKSVSIVNHSTVNAIFVTPEQSNARAFFGKIDPGAALDLHCNMRVYALCDTGLTAEVSVFQEYTVADNE